MAANCLNSTGGTCWRRSVIDGVPEREAKDNSGGKRWQDSATQITTYDYLSKMRS